MTDEIIESEIADYSKEGFKILLVIDKVVTYASVNAMMYPDHDGLDFTGNFFIYLLHPVTGSAHFTMEFESELDKWVTRDADPRIEHSIINKIADSIRCRRM